MKNYSIPLFLVCLHISVICQLILLNESQAAEISQQTAVKVAQGFISINQSMIPLNLDAYEVAHRGGYLVGQSSLLLDEVTFETLAYVLHLKPKGFVVLSAESRLSPVIAFSYASNFPMRENPNNILPKMLKEDIRNRLLTISAMPHEVIDANEDMWTAYLVGEQALFASTMLYDQWPSGDNDGWLDTTWAQGSPTGIENDNCPDDPNTNPGDHTDDGRCVTGCAPTSMAQIVNYWEYPSSVTFIAADNYISVCNPMDGYGVRNIPINAPTASMPSINYNMNGDHPANAAIAQLMFACGVAELTQYSDSESSTLWNNVAIAYHGKFCYASARSTDPITNPNFYTDLEKDMKNARPAQMCIGKYLGDEKGHSIVCDGLRMNPDGTNKFWHLNFGWGPDEPDPISEAWYDLPAGLPAGYTVVAGAIVNIDPCMWVPDFYATIQSAVNAAQSGQTVVVRAGTYTGVGNRDIDFGGKNIILRSEKGAALTIIDCQNSGRGFYFSNNETSTCVLAGFTIQNGSATSGGGIYIYNSSPTIKNCIITGSTATQYLGGGIYCGYGCSAIIRNCEIRNNTAPGAGYGGGGIACYNSSPVIRDCIISENSALPNGDGGGIVYYSYAHPTINKCIITDNLAAKGGGISGINNGSVGMVNNCIIAGNSGDWGGGIRCFEADLTLNNCTLSANISPNGAGICIKGNPTINNSIFWDNNPQEIYVISGTPILNYCDVEGGWSGAGTGNINSDPLFVSSALCDYYLSQIAAGQGSDSPCVNAGSDTAQNLGLDRLFTRTDSVLDSSIVDMGYHSYALKIDSISRSPGSITIHWNGIIAAGTSYIVQWSTDLMKWRNIPVGGTDTWVDMFVSATKKFYRVMEE